MRKGILKEYSKALDVLMRVLDLTAIFTAALAACYWVFGSLAIGNSYKITILFGMLFGLIFFNRFALYRAWRGSSIFTELWVVTGAWASVFLGLSAVDFLTRSADRATVDVAWVLRWMLLSWVMLCLFRIALRLTLRYLRIHGRNHRRIVLVVASDLGVKIARSLNDAPHAGLDVVGYFDDRPRERLPADIGNIPILGSISELPAYVHKYSIDQVWLAFPFRAEERVKHVLHELRHCTADIRMVPDIYQFRLLNHSMSEVVGMPVINLSANPIVGFDKFIKYLEDRLFGLLILFLISPLMMVVALAIKLDSRGTVFFKQQRHGWDGRPISVWKFRTMKMNSDPDGEVPQATRDDPRITRVGSFLRRTSLDELPQFFNVLQGTMSIVGPRPHAVEHNEAFKESISQYMLRHKVKPGITGWAQVNGYRGETDTLEKMQKRIEHDLYYIENWSFWFDVRIILMTVFTGFINRNAY